MSLLLKEIKHIDQRAADVLKQADLHTDSDIQALTREELLELFPGVKDLKLRRTIFDVIHKQRPVELILNKLKEFIPSESFRDALTDNGVLVDYLRILKDMRAQTNNVQSFLEAHIGLLEEFRKYQPNQDSANCGPVTAGSPREARGSGTSDASGKKMQQIGATGGHPQERQKYWSGPSTSATGDPLKRHSVQHDVRPGGAQDSLLGSGTSDVGVQVGPPTGHTGGHSPGTQKSSSGPSPSVTGGPVERHSVQGYDRPQRAPESSSGPSPSVTGDPVKRHSGQSDGRPGEAPATLYNMVISGKTFDTHLKLMEKVKKSVQNQIQHCEGDQDGKITFVFCPISSRIASDVEAAMSDVKDDKPVILVLMHHSREPRTTISMRTWRDYARVEMHVNVFYHETIGLLKCEPNDAAVTEIQNKLLERFIQRTTLYKMVVSGKTFDTHLKLMEKVKKSVQNQIQHCEGDQDGKITFVFCPISSRIASDVEAAMTDVKDDKPVILVLMHHSREPRTTTSMRTWQDDLRVVLHVNVFYHETMGLLKCERNDAAVTEIQNKLLDCFIQRSKDTSGNAQGVGADHRGANYWGTDNSSIKSSIRGLFWR